VRRLLQRGFHSGTVPKLFAKLRAAERTAYASGNWRLARTYRLRLDETAEAVKRFVERELVTLLEESEVWEGEHLNVGRVSLATNALRVELVHAGFPADPIWLEVETRSGWMVAGLAERGWLGKLPREQACTLMAGLAYLYKVAGVDLVREQVRAALPASVASYDLTPNRLVLWLDQRHGMSILYDLRDPTGQMEPLTPAGTPAPGWPVLDKWRVVFSTVPLYWSDWEQVWQREREGCPRLLNTELDLSLLGPAAPRLTGTNGVLAPANLRADRPSSARAEDV